jgi:hypothetical protein
VAGPDDDFVRLFARAPGVRYERVRPDERHAACAAYPDALVLLTTGDLPRGIPNPIDLPIPALAAFPSSGVLEAFSGSRWYQRIWRFRLVRCADYTAWANGNCDGNVAATSPCRDPAGPHRMTTITGYGL